MSLPDNHIKNGEIIVYLDSVLFSKDSIFKCLYWYTENFSVKSEINLEEHFIKISLRQKESTKIDSDLENILLKLERDLLDFNLRDIVTKETKNIRDLLIAKAFSHGEFDELPPGEISDPVGFNINQI